MNTSAKIQQQLDKSRLRLFEAIEWLPDEALIKTGTLGLFSIADLLALLTAWEAELVTGLMRLNQGKKPDKLLAALAKPDAYNARRFRENKDRDLDAIFDDFQRVRVQLETWLEEFSERELVDPQRYPFFQGKSLAQIIAETTYEIEARYIFGVEAFVQKWQTRSSNGRDLEFSAN